AFLRTGAAACGLDGQSDLDVTVWDVVHETSTYPRMEDVDALFLTGSMTWGWEEERAPPKGGGLDLRRVTGWPAGLILAVCFAEFNAFDDTPWVLRLVDYVKDVLAQRRVRLVGVCFGHQIIGRAMGAPVGRSEGGAWEVSVCDVQLTAQGTKVFGGREGLMHKDIVFEYPAGVESLGSSESCLVQGMYVPNRIITVQGHPEFTEEILREILEVRHSQGIFSDEIYEEAIGRVGRKHDGLLVAK
ncbi:MAG: hypothetical protein Q9214_008104, partial [Letrouitia sp. 1 TL-2023]